MMKAIYFSPFVLASFLLIQCVSSVTFKSRSGCPSLPEAIFETDTVYFSWLPYNGSTSCNLELNLYNIRTFEISLTYKGGSSSARCDASASTWTCYSFIYYSTCPVLMYSLTSYSSYGYLLSNDKITTFKSSYLKLKYCGTNNMKATISIKIYPTTAYYWYNYSSWQFVYIGLPILVIAGLICSLMIYKRQRRNRILQAQRHQQMISTVSMSTTTGALNPGYENNQPFIYPRQPPTYNNADTNNMPPSYSQLGYNQVQMTK